MLSVEHLKKSFGELEILKDISMHVSDGEIVTIIGPSGTGKTTLLRCINFLERADGGTVTIDDVTVECQAPASRDILSICRRSGMVFQTFNLFRNKTVLENVTEGLTVVKRLPKRKAIEIAREKLETVGMLDHADHYPSQISGGQQQRVAIARAIAMEPSILLFDEPTSALDPELSKEVLTTIKKVAEQGATMLIVTHEIAFAQTISDRIIFMENGLIVEEGPPEQVIANPKELRTRQFMRRIRPEDYEYII